MNDDCVYSRMPEIDADGLGRRISSLLHARRDYADAPEAVVTVTCVASASNRNPDLISTLFGDIVRDVPNCTISERENPGSYRRIVDFLASDGSTSHARAAVNDQSRFFVDGRPAEREPRTAGIAFNFTTPTGARILAHTVDRAVPRPPRNPLDDPYLGVRFPDADGRETFVFKYYPDPSNRPVSKAAFASGRDRFAAEAEARAAPTVATPHAEETHAFDPHRVEDPCTDDEEEREYPEYPEDGLARAEELAPETRGAYAGPQSVARLRTRIARTREAIRAPKPETIDEITRRAFAQVDLRGPVEAEIAALGGPEALLRRAVRTISRRMYAEWAEPLAADYRAVAAECRPLQNELRVADGATSSMRAELNRLKEARLPSYLEIKKVVSAAKRLETSGKYIDELLEDVEKRMPILRSLTR